jgi:hypothetical protein
MMMAWSVPVLVELDAIGNGSTSAWSCAPRAAHTGLIELRYQGVLARRAQLGRTISRRRHPLGELALSQ